MGRTNHVKDKEHRLYEQSYSFYTEKGIGRLLKDFHKLKIRAYERGDLAAVDIRIDLQKAIELANLTDKQKQALDLLYNHDLSLKEAAAILGVDDSTLSRTRKAALNKIAKVYREWKYIE